MRIVDRFFITALKFIPTITGIKDTKDEQKCSQWFLLPFATISHRVILRGDYNSDYSILLWIIYLKFIMFIKPKLGTGAARDINEFISLI